jgi:hypothetical protein
MSDSNKIDQIVQDILADMPLKEKAAIANLNEDKVPYLQYAFDTCIRSQLGRDDEMSKDVMTRKLEDLIISLLSSIILFKNASPINDSSIRNHFFSAI